MNTNTHNRKWRAVRTLLVVVVSALIVTSLFRLTEAGSLTPSAAPASSSQSFEDLWASLASSAYDSSGISASRTGNALQITKCIILKITGGTPCP